MRCRLRGSVKRVVSAGVNGEGEWKRLGFDTRRRKVFGARSGAGKNAADPAARATPPRHAVTLRRKHGTTPSNLFINGSQSPFGTGVWWHGDCQCVGTNRQAYNLLHYPSGVLFIVLLSNGLRSGLRYELRKLTGWL